MGENVAHILDSLLEILVNKQRYKFGSFRVGINEAFEALELFHRMTNAYAAHNLTSTNAVSSSRSELNASNQTRLNLSFSSSTSWTHFKAC